MATRSSIFYRIIRAGIGGFYLFGPTKSCCVKYFGCNHPFPSSSPSKKTQELRHYTTLCDTILHDFFWKRATDRGHLTYGIKGGGHIFGSICHIFCRNPLISRDFYATRMPVVWPIWGASFLEIWGVVHHPKRKKCMLILWLRIWIMNSIHIHMHEPFWEALICIR